MAQLTEAHWSFMDRYADAMIARGPTLAADRATATGSMHMVELPDAAAARVFAFEEPCYVAGVYSEVMVRRWRHALVRTMWEFDGDAVANRRFLVIGHGSPDTNAVGSALRAAQRRYFVDGGYLERMIARGPLLSDPRSVSKNQPPSLKPSTPAGSSMTPSSETFSLMTIFPIFGSPFVRVVSSDTGGGDNGTAGPFRDELVSFESIRDGKRL